METEAVMISAVVTFLVIIPAAFLCFCPMKNQLRFSLGRTILLMSGFFVIVISLMTCIAVYFSLQPNTILFPVLVILFFFYHSLLQVHISKSLAVYVSVTALMSIFAMYAVCFDAPRHPSLGADSYTLDYGLFQLGISTAAALLLAFPLSKYGSRLIDSLNISTVWYWTVPFSVLMLNINLFLRPVKYETFHVNRVAESVLRILGALLLLWILMHIIFYFITTAILSAAKIKEEKQFLEIQESQFLAQQRYMDATARERHDFRHSIRALLELYEAGDYESLGQYLRQYEQSMPQSEMQPFCTNYALNAVLNYYVSIAIKAGIDMQIDIHFPEHLSIPEVEICRIVGNLMENAIAGAQTAEDKWIHLSIADMHATELYIIATNSFDGKVRKKDGRYQSTHHSGNGIGLASIISIAEKRGGMAEFSHEGTVFYSNIVLSLS